MQIVSTKKLMFARDFNTRNEPQEVVIVERGKPTNVPDWIERETVFQLGLKPHLDHEKVLIPATITRLDTPEQRKSFDTAQDAPQEAKPDKKGK